MGITVYFGQRKGSASTADFSLDAVRATVAKACSIARFTAEDDCAGLGGAFADGALAARSGSVASMECQRGSCDRDRQNLRGGGAGIRPAHQQFGGCLGRHPPRASCLRQYARLHRRLSDHLAQLELRGARRHRGGHAARLLVYEFAGLARAAGCGGGRARKRTAHHRPPGAPQAQHAARAGACSVPRWRAGSSDISAGRYAAAASIGNPRSCSIRPDSRYFPEGFSIVERPHIPKAMASAPFDEEGVATRDRELIADGVLTGYILSSYSARKLGLRPPAMRAGRTIFWWRRTPPGDSRRCWDAWAAGCW